MREALFIGGTGTISMGITSKVNPIPIDQHFHLFELRKKHNED